MFIRASLSIAQLIMILWSGWPLVQHQRAATWEVLLCFLIRSFQLINLIALKRQEKVFSHLFKLSSICILPKTRGRMWVRTTDRCAEPILLSWQGKACCSHTIIRKRTTAPNIPSSHHEKSYLYQRGQLFFSNVPLHLTSETSEKEPLV